MKLWLDGTVEEVLEDLPLDQLAPLSGPFLIGRMFGSDVYMRAFEGMLDDIGLSQDPDRFYPVD